MAQRGVRVRWYQGLRRVPHLTVSPIGVVSVHRPLSGPKHRQHSQTTEAADLGEDEDDDTCLFVYGSMVSNATAEYARGFKAGEVYKFRTSGEFSQDEDMCACCERDLCDSMQGWVRELWKKAREADSAARLAAIYDGRGHPMSSDDRSFHLERAEQQASDDGMFAALLAYEGGPALFNAKACQKLAKDFERYESAGTCAGAESTNFFDLMLEATAMAADGGALVLWPLSAR